MYTMPVKDFQLLGGNLVISLRALAAYAIARDRPCLEEIQRLVAEGTLPAEIVPFIKDDARCRPKDTAYTGVADAVKIVFEDGPKKRLAFIAASQGDIDVLKWLRQSGFQFTRNLAHIALLFRRTRCLTYLYENGVPTHPVVPELIAQNRFDEFFESFCRYIDGEVILEEMARVDFLSGFKYVDSLKLYSWSSGAHEIAARVGNVEFLKYTVNRKSMNDADYIIRISAANGHLDCLEYLHREHVKLEDCHSENLLASGDHVDCLKFMYEQGCKVTKWAMELVIMNGRMKCLEFLLQNGELLSPAMAVNAARGSLEMLTYLHKKGCYLRKEVAAEAARTGNLPCLRYAIENGCVMTDKVAILAAMNGHIECLRYALENGCSRSEGVLLGAAYYGKLECFDAAWAEGCRPSHAGWAQLRCARNRAVAARVAELAP